MQPSEEREDADRSDRSVSSDREIAPPSEAQTPTAPINDTIIYTAGVTDLKALAESRGLRYESDIREERVINRDGTVIIRVDLKPVNMRGPKRKDPQVWMRSVRWHTYQGKPQDVDSVYLAYENDVENILNLKFARLENPPRRAVRRPLPPSKVDVAKKGV